MRSKKRRYRMGARKERVAETRQRIVEAIVALHEEVGPRNTTVKGIAERAGVERLTVYRHFPDDHSMFRACSSCWLESHPPPDPTGWSGNDSRELTGSILLAMNRYYGKGQRMLRQIYRDVEDIPALEEVMQGFTGYLEAVALKVENAWTAEGKAPPKALHATIRHALDFTTWDSLEKRGLSDKQKSDIESVWISAAAGKG